jgi:arylsulfatase A-like enzyme
LLWNLRRPSGGAPDAIFLIVVDALRPDRLSCYGCRTNETPNIDRLAERGVRFERASSAASWTVPSMGSVMTSRYPTQLGLVERPREPGRRPPGRRDKRPQLDRTIPPRERTLAEIFRSAGFHTAAFVNQPALFVGDGFRQGFDEWFYPVSAERVGRYEPGERPPSGIPFARAAGRLDRELVAAFREWLGGRNAEKMFVWIHLLTPHSPYVPPSDHAPPPGSESGAAGLYDGEIRSADEMVGDAVAAIEEAFGSDRAAIVFTSDHGEAFGEHGLNEHGNSLHREVVEVPLILVAPSLPAGRAASANARAIDLLPTILDLAGIAWSAPDPFEGVSLLARIRGAAPELPVFWEGMLYGSTERSLASGGYKLMYDEEGERYALYDLSWDVNETVDLAARQPERALEMSEALAAVHERLLRDHEPLASSTEEEEEALEAMKALGYVGD